MRNSKTESWEMPTFEHNIKYAVSQDPITEKILKIYSEKVMYHYLK